MTVVPIRNEPEVMTGRARVYLVIAAARHLLVGFFCIAAPSTFQSSSFEALRGIMSLWLWGFVFSVAGLTCAFAAITRHDFSARLGLIMSATTTVVWAAGITLSMLTGDLASPTGPIIWWAVAFKDFVICAQPMRSPFEPIVRRVRSERDSSRRAP